MKKILATIALFTVSIPLVLAQAKKQGAIHTRVLLITPQTKIHYLDSVSKAWEKDSITLTFSKMEYNAKGKLVHLKGSVDVVKNGQHASGTFASDNLVSYEIKADSRPGISIKGK